MNVKDVLLDKELREISFSELFYEIYAFDGKESEGIREVRSLVESRVDLAFPIDCGLLRREIRRVWGKQEFREEWLFIFGNEIQGGGRYKGKDSWQLRFEMLLDVYKEQLSLVPYPGVRGQNPGGDRDYFSEEAFENLDKCIYRNVAEYILHSIKRPYLTSALMICCLSCDVPLVLYFREHFNVTLKEVDAYSGLIYMLPFIESNYKEFDLERLFSAEDYDKRRDELSYSIHERIKSYWADQGVTC